MPINMLKMLFPRTPTTELNKYINKKDRLYEYNNSQHNTIKCMSSSKYKGIEFHVVFCSTWKWSSTPWDAELWEIWIAECELHSNRYNLEKGIDKQSRQYKSYISKVSKVDPFTVQNEQNSDYFIAGLEKEADMAANAKITKEMHNGNHTGNLYKIRVMKRECIITRTQMRNETWPPWAENFLHDELKIRNTLWMNNMLDN